MKTNKHFYHILLRYLRVKNVSDKSYRENQNTYFVFSNFFSKIVPLMRYCGKIL